VRTGLRSRRRARGARTRRGVLAGTSRTSLALAPGLLVHPRTSPDGRAWCDPAQAKGATVSLALPRRSRPSEQVARERGLPGPLLGLRGVHGSRGRVVRLLSAFRASASPSSRPPSTFFANPRTGPRPGHGSARFLLAAGARLRRGARTLAAFVGHDGTPGRVDRAPTVRGPACCRRFPLPSWQGLALGRAQGHDRASPASSPSTCREYRLATWSPTPDRSSMRLPTILPRVAACLPRGAGAAATNCRT